MKRAPKLLAAFLVVSSLSVAYAQTPAMMGDGVQGFQAGMQKMQEEMAKIRSTTDPAERQKLILEHMSTMREAMGTMMKMGGPGTGLMPGGGMMMGGPAAAPAPGEVPGRMGMMEQRMGMMQMMMEQMMQHQEMMDRRQ